MYKQICQYIETVVNTSISELTLTARWDSHFYVMVPYKLRDF